jgi:hypothetical protein
VSAVLEKKAGVRLLGRAHGTQGDYGRTGNAPGVRGSGGSANAAEQRQTMTALNLLTNFDATLAAMAEVEANPAWLVAQKIPPSGTNVPAALEFLKEIADFSSDEMKTIFFVVPGHKINLWAWIIVGSGEVYFGKRRENASVELACTVALASAHGFQIVDWQPPT